MTVTYVSVTTTPHFGLLTIVILDAPFTGSVSIKPDAFLHLLTTPAARPERQRLWTAAGTRQRRRRFVLVLARRPAVAFRPCSATCFFTAA